MPRSSSRRTCTGHENRAGAALAFCGALAVAASSARAEVLQTDSARTPLPQPVGTTELALGPAWGFTSTTQSYHDPMTGQLLSTPIVYGEYYSPPKFPQFVDGDALTLEGLFKWRGEQIDPIADATLGAGHFPPGCEFRAELVLQGGDCDVALGWYNFNGSEPPALTDIQPLVPQGSTYLHAALTLSPLAWDNRDPHDLSRQLWTPQVFSSGDIIANAKYAGGDVAFVMLGDPFSSCTAEKFSVYDHNPRNAAGVPWVTAVTYRSTLDPSAIYLAFEDLPMSAEDWRDSGGMWENDADFNDAVFYISGLGATASCPDPACRDVACEAGELCSQGSCMPTSGGSGGAGDGGASSDGGTEEMPGGAAGSPMASEGGRGNGMAGAGAGEAAELAGGAPPVSGGGSRGGRAPGEIDADPGCACRAGSHAPPARSSWLALALALVLHTRRRHRLATPRVA